MRSGSDGRHSGTSVSRVELLSWFSVRCEFTSVAGQDPPHELSEMQIEGRCKLDWRRSFHASASSQDVRGARKGGEGRLSLADGQVDAMKPLQFVSLSRQLRPQVRRTAAALSMTRRCDRAKGKSGSVPLHARRHLYS